MFVDSLGPDPVSVFLAWYEEAVQANEPMPDAMTLATATLDGKPSARVVLYKGLYRGSLRFHTNYESRKAAEIAGNPQVAAVFHWRTLARQVRVEGRAETLTEAESDEYFRSRAKASQLGAWASPQSRPVDSREALELRYAELEREYESSGVPRPPFWGGYRILPSSFEFWLGREHRLHDRFVYRTSGRGWQLSRLAP